MAQEQTTQKGTLQLTSSAFKHGDGIPSQYTCDGVNVSPPLAWNRPPAEARSLVLIADDPDAPGKTWVHWVLFNLPASTIELHEDTPKNAKLPNGAIQGTNDFHKVGYGGPCPPGGTHRYFFRLYALPQQLTLGSTATKSDVMKAMEGHILAQGELMGTYTRK